jgi:hypothetical protein
MKKLLGWLLVVMLGISACEGPIGPPGRDGRDGRNGKDAESTQWYIEDLEVRSQDWNFVNDEMDGNQWYLFEYEFSLPELDQFVFMQGAVSCYLVHNVNYGGNSIRVHSLLPFTVYGEEDYPFSENYSCELRPGYINFVVKYSDWSPDILPPTRKFHVVLMW